MSRLQTRFSELSTRGEAALIADLLVGDPDLTRTREYARALISAEIDVLELGIPFSDPLLENGPTFQAASARALASGTTPLAVFEWVKELRRETSTTPIVLRTYYNPVFVMGEEAFLVRDDPGMALAAKEA